MKPTLSFTPLTKVVREQYQTGVGDMTTFLKQFWTDESGATAIEYGLIAALIAAVIITAVSSIGGEVKNMFQEVEQGIKGRKG